MSHLTNERLMTVALQLAEPTAQETKHLAACEICRRAFERSALLGDDMNVYKQSQPEANDLQRYYRLFDQVQGDQALSKAAGLKGRLLELAAVLGWDSRQQMALEGVRRVTSTEYRLVYDTELAEVELMVEIDGSRRHLEGDLIPLTTRALVPALLQLHVLDDPAVGVQEAEIGDEMDMVGRFRFQDLRPGRYRFTVTTALDLNITVDELDIT